MSNAGRGVPLEGASPRGREGGSGALGDGMRVREGRASRRHVRGRGAEGGPPMAPVLWGRGLGREEGSRSSLAELGSGPRMLKRSFCL